MLRPRDILITTPTFPPYVDGVANVTRHHATGFLAAGHRVTVATGSHPARGMVPTPRGLRVVEFNVSGSSNLRRPYSGDIGTYRHFVDGFRGDVIFHHCWQTWTTDLVAMRPVHGGPLRVLVSHGFSANSRIGWPRTLPWWIGWRPYVWWHIPKTLQRLDGIIFLSGRRDSDRFYDGLLAAKLRVQNATVIPNGVDLASHDDAPGDFRRRHCIGDRLLLLCVGEFSKLKNEAAVARAVLASGIQDAVLVLIGPSLNDYARSILALWASHPRRRPDLRLQLLTGASEHEVLAAYRDADIYLGASVTECFPLVVLDAMASRTPFLFTDVGCVGDLPGGLTVRSVTEMPEAIDWLAGNRSLRERLGAEGRAACEMRFSWPCVISEYERLMERLLS